MMKVKFTKEQTDLFNQAGTIVNTANGNTYRYIPFWFKETEQEDVYELLTFEQLPDDLIDAVMKVKTCNKLAVNSILNDYNNALANLTEQIESLEKIYHNLSHLKIKELNILRGKKSQLEECIEIIQKYHC